MKKILLFGIFLSTVATAATLYFRTIDGPSIEKTSDDPAVAATDLSRSKAAAPMPQPQPRRETADAGRPETGSASRPYSSGLPAAPPAAPNFPIIRQPVTRSIQVVTTNPAARIDPPAPSAYRSAPPQTGTRSLPAVPTGGSVEEIVVPPGAILPAAVIDSAVGASPEAVGVLDRIGNDFLDRVTSEGNQASAGGDVGTSDAGSSPETASNSNGQREKNGNADEETGPSPAPSAGNQSEWDAAAREADELYRAIFGVAAFNRKTTEAAIDRLESR